MVQIPNASNGVRLWCKVCYQRQNLRSGSTYVGASRITDTGRCSSAVHSRERKATQEPFDGSFRTPSTSLEYRLLFQVPVDCPTHQRRDPLFELASMSILRDQSNTHCGDLQPYSPILQDSSFLVQVVPRRRTSCCSNHQE